MKREKGLKRARGGRRSRRLHLTTNLLPRDTRA